MTRITEYDGKKYAYDESMKTNTANISLRELGKLIKSLNKGVDA